MNTSTRPETAPPAGNAGTAPPPPPTSTLIEFPRAGRAPRPQWRKELSERVREIQQRRAHEAAREAEELGLPAPPENPREIGAAQLGLVPPPETPELNPLVAKALERIERARQQQQQHANAARAQTRAGAAAAATARYAEEEPVAAAQARAETTESRVTQPLEAGAVALEPAPAEVAEVAAESARPSNLVIVPPAPPAPAAPAASEADRVITEALNRPRPRRHLGEVADDALLARREAATAPLPHAPAEEAATDRAPLFRRLAAGVSDLLIAAFASSPFAAVIELTSGNWHDPRVSGSLAGIFVVLLFVYLTATVAFSGRTWGMALVGLRAVDARTGLIPATGQCVRRALVYMLSLATLGVGLLLALFDAEGRAAHDHLSGTIVVKDS